VDVVHGEVLKPCSSAFCKVERQVLDDKEVVVLPARSISEEEVFQPYDGVGVP
jgi:hypothetical protein